MKTIFIRIALKMLKKIIKNNPNIDYHALSKYGVKDVLKNPHTNEDMYIL